MKFSEKWLREWVNPALTTEQLTESLTMAGLEVDSVAPAAGVFSNVVVAEVLNVEPHPNADRLRLCRVNNGSEELSIVCGATNVRHGLKVALANIGTLLPNGIKIKKSKIRGVESHGMICSTSELGFTENSTGIMELPDSAPIGEDINFYLELDDQIIDLDLTANRGDCLSIRGIARDVAAITSEPLIAQDGKEAISATIEDTFPVEIVAPEDCPRYAGRVIRNINARAETPIWMQERLRRSGIRAIAPVVDVTNFVMLELGQPLHAFDLDNLAKTIIVRRANPEEKITLLNDQEVTLKTDTLVIADAEKPLAIAGIMGGKGSGVTEDTQHIFLESAYFNSITLHGHARRYGLFTDSAHRFERGVDPMLQAAAIERATELLLEIVGGEPGPISDVISGENLPKCLEIFLDSKRLSECLGLQISDEIIEDILKRLHMPPSRVGNGWQVKIPSFRFDLEKDVDLIEEVARIYGYQEIPSKYPEKLAKIQQPKEANISVHQLRQCLAQHGYHEIITYSFVDPTIQNLLDSESEPLKLMNPISPELSVMRTNLWPGLINVALHNQRRQQTRLRIFEVGQRFIQKDAYNIQEQMMIAGLITGTLQPEHWSETSRSVDFFDLKGDVEAMLQLTRQAGHFTFAPASHPALHPGQSCKITYEGKEVGYLGALHPEIENTLDIQGPVYLFELLLEPLSQSVLPKFRSLSKYPAIRRDIALLIDKAITAQAVKDTITKAAGSLLTNLSIFDLYEGAGIQSDKKSLAIALLLQHNSRTLVDSDVSELMNNVITVLKEEFNAQIRGDEAVSEIS